MFYMLYSTVRYTGGGGTYLLLVLRAEYYDEICRNWYSYNLYSTLSVPHPVISLLLKYRFFSLFELKCREKNFDSAPSPRQQVNPQLYTVGKIQTTDVHNRNCLSFT
jgi:hypothetical protein